MRLTCAPPPRPEHGEPEVAHVPQVVGVDLRPGPLGVEQLQQRCRAFLVLHLHEVADPACAPEEAGPQPLYQTPVRLDRGAGLLDIGQRLRPQLLLLDALRAQVRLGARDLSRLPVEDRQRKLHPERQRRRLERVLSRSFLRILGGERHVRDPLSACEREGGFRARLLRGRGEQVGPAPERLSREDVERGSCLGQRAVEERRVDGELLRRRIAHAEEERDLQPGGDQGLLGQIDALLGLQRRHLRPRQLGVRDGSGPQPSLVERARALGGFGELAGERELRLLQRPVQDGLPDLEGKRAKRVVARSLRRRQGRAGDLDPQPALSADQIGQRRRIGQSDRPRRRRASGTRARVVVERPAGARRELRIGERSCRRRIAFGGRDLRLCDQQIESALAKDAERVIHREHRGKGGQRDRCDQGHPRFLTVRLLGEFGRTSVRLRADFLVDSMCVAIRKAAP